MGLRVHSGVTYSPANVMCVYIYTSASNVFVGEHILDRTVGGAIIIQCFFQHRDIIEEENRTDEMPGHWFNQDANENPISPIERDPDAPTKPVRQYPPGDRPVMHVSSNSSELPRDVSMVISL